MPISSRIADESDWACFWVKSARIFEERSATDCTTLGSTCGIAHDAIGTLGALQAPGVIEIVQMGDRFAHGEESLARVERPAKQQAKQITRAALLVFQRIFYFLEMCLVVALEFGHAQVRAAERLAVRGQH